MDTLEAPASASTYAAHIAIISTSKRLPGSPTCSAESGPASHPGQPPERAGTYSLGAPAAPAASTSAVASTPTSPPAPAARSIRGGVEARLSLRRAPWRPRRSDPPDPGARSIGDTASIAAFLRPPAPGAPQASPAAASLCTDSGPRG
jgi:hypothetical protein